jgi:hypothetical protein
MKTYPPAWKSESECIRAYAQAASKLSEIFEHSSCPVALETLQGLLQMIDMHAASILDCEGQRLEVAKRRRAARKKAPTIDVQKPILGAVPIKGAA